MLISAARRLLPVAARRPLSAEAALPELETLQLSWPSPGVVQVALNRPSKSNAMNQAMWREFVEAFDAIAATEGVRAVVLAGNGRNFTAGLDLADHVELLAGGGADSEVSRRAFQLRGFIDRYQRAFDVVDKCRVPVVAAIHGACVGAGVDLASACDVRMCSSDAWFCIKEVDIGLAADVGTLQRMPKVCGNDSLLRELAYTGRSFTSTEAQALGFVSRVTVGAEDAQQQALELAATIASKSPVAVIGTKHNLNFSRDHSVADGLAYMSAWNMGMLQSSDVLTAAQAGLSGEEPVFAEVPV